MLPKSARRVTENRAGGANGTGTVIFCFQFFAICRMICGRKRHTALRPASARNKNHTHKQCRLYPELVASPKGRCQSCCGRRKQSRKGGPLHSESGSSLNKLGRRLIPSPFFHLFYITARDFYHRNFPGIIYQRFNMSRLVQD